MSLYLTKGVKELIGLTKHKFKLKSSQFNHYLSTVRAASFIVQVEVSLCIFIMYIYEVLKTQISDIPKFDKR